MAATRSTEAAKVCRVPDTFAVKAGLIWPPYAGCLMDTSATCPECSSSAVFYSQRRPTDGLPRILFCSAFHCRACGHRFFRIKLMAVAATAGFLLALATFIGVGEVVWTHHAKAQSAPIASAPAVIGNA